jgi:cytochrome c-550 PedF
MILLALTAFGSAAIAWAQDAPAPPNTTGLPSLGADWRATNPYRGDAKAITYGKNLFAENCARCHGIGAISGGIAPDLRYLPAGAEGDAIFSNRVQNGSSKDGRVLMPKWGGVLGQEALWTIRSWLDTVREE